MDVIMKTLMAGPGGVRHPGERCTVTPKEAAMLVEGGYADTAEAAAKVRNKAETKAAETKAPAAGDGETAGGGQGAADPAADPAP